MNSTPTREQIGKALEALNYPASKEDVVEHAARQGAEEPVLGLLRALPVAIYGDREQVLAAVPFDQGSVGEDQDMEDKMNERRHHTHSGLAEHEKQTPRSPIEEGLGYNRGS